MATYRHWSVSLWQDPNDVPHCRIMSRQNWMAAYLGYNLRMKTLFRGWPVMVHDTHTRRSLGRCKTLQQSNCIGIIRLRMDVYWLSAIFLIGKILNLTWGNLPYRIFLIVYKSSCSTIRRPLIKNCGYASVTLCFGEKILTGRMSHKICDLCGRCHLLKDTTQRCRPQIMAVYSIDYRCFWQ